MPRSQFPEDVLIVADRAYQAWANDKTMPIIDAIASAVIEDRKARTEGAVAHRLVATAPVTGKQREVAEFILSYSVERGYAPSYDEIRDGVGLQSKSGIHRLVQGLIERGVLETAVPGVTARARCLSVAERFVR